MDPQSIERRSMEIIEGGLNERSLLSGIPKGRLHIVKRVIHATADFDFAETLAFSDDALEAAVRAIAGNPVFVTDTNMIATGINKKALTAHGGSVRCYISEPETEEQAKERGVTRAVVSMERAAEDFPEAVYVIGNAPTALLRICELTQAGRMRPALVIGVPVGFVNVIESKEALIKMAEGTKIPYIVANGLKGGSTVAAAIVNALLYGAQGN